VDEFSGVTLCIDVGPAEWLYSALRPWSRGIEHVATLVPTDYPSHGRILHRAASETERAVRWADIAAVTGQSITARTRYIDLVGWHADDQHQSPPAPWREPETGTLLPDECAAVASVLAKHTNTPDDCWFCVWEGYGWDELNRLGKRAPRVALEHRNCLLFRGPVVAATAFRSGPAFQSPMLWWPADRAWCVRSELDIYSTYVASTSVALGALRDQSALEVVECSAEDDIDHGWFP
jgi:hypothetical protein